jgi:hypothetical protein
VGIEALKVALNLWVFNSSNGTFIELFCLDLHLFPLSLIQKLSNMHGLYVDSKACEGA